MPQLEHMLGHASFNEGAEDTRFAALLAEAAGNGCSNLQRELTRLREKSRYNALDVSIRALPFDDLRLAVWVNSDRFSTTWFSVWPSAECRDSNLEFAEIAARYYGLPSPACASLVGQPIVNTRTVFDIHGSRLTTASLPGDGFRTQHDAIKWRLGEDLRETGVRARTEV